ncbi:MAG TPA: VCBS repeat-containing protein, partial [Verrucomicrobiae bacterium]|nr:VCBS repeat-containing protein [Verrucomicrobiae bacterium]
MKTLDWPRREKQPVCPAIRSGSGSPFRPLRSGHGAPFLRRAAALGLAACCCVLGVVRVRAGTENESSASLLTRPEVMAKALEQRGEKQAAEAAKSLKAFHDFQFTNMVATSGIGFEQHVVDDAGKFYKAVHYDHGNGIAVADVDGDGLLDVYFTTQLGTNGLYRNLGNGKFEDITAKAGVGLPDQISVTASFADVDNDGLPDLFVTTVRHGNHLFKNLGQGRFEDVTRSAGLDYSGHCSGAVFFDYDNDGRLDLFLCNVGKYTTDTVGRGGYYVGYVYAFSGHQYSYRVEHCILYHNEGNGRFKNVTADVGLDKFVSWTGDATFTDLNGDGFPDLYVLNMQG